MKSILRISVRHSSKYAFYDLVLATPRVRPQTFEGNYKLDGLTPEQRIEKVFGTRIKGETRQSSSRITRGEPKVIAGVTVPAKPDEPDNCCMSGCINCVWELFNDDLKEWNEKRKHAAEELKRKGGRWPENFNAPVSLLNKENLPKSMENKVEHKNIEEDVWGDVPESIRVFAEMERKMKERKRAQL